MAPKPQNSAFGGSRGVARKTQKTVTASKAGICKTTASGKSVNSKSATTAASSKPLKKQQKPPATPSKSSTTRKKRDSGLPPGYVWEVDRGGENNEKRLRPARKVSQQFRIIQERALSQTMYVLDRKRGRGRDGLEETVQIAGTTGNVYTVKISRLLSCDCPHALKGNHCKHIVYVLAKTLKTPEDLQCQRALLSNEVNSILKNSPPLPSQLANKHTKNRKSIAADDDCAICCDSFGENENEITYCRASCGNNIHKQCFRAWEKSSKGGEVRCPFCRSIWDKGPEDMAQIASLPGQRSSDGPYRNLGRELGLSGITDYSTYHTYRRWGGGSWW